ncbi:MAG: long-chain fatty acid--CoA ligase, partial [Acidobacteriota bacterium]
APDEPAVVIYTSGTTGEPKGVILTHRNILGTLEAVVAAFGDISALRLNLSFLPLAHALERIAGHFLPLVQGNTIAYARSLDTLAEDFRAVRPDFAVAVPRVFEKVHARIHTQVRGKPAPARALFRWAVGVGVERSLRLERGQPIPPSLAARYAAADLLVFRAIRARLGGRLRLFVSGGAPLAADIARFFHAAGILVCEGWGATETSAPSTWNTPAAYRFGSVGRPLPGVEVRLDADGELQVRGVNVFPGYLDNPEANAEAFTPDGFWRSGDIGRVDEEGFYYITDRKKELIITAGGKNIAPQKLENLLRQRPLISHCLVHGDRRPYVVALLTVDRAALAAAHPELADASPEDERLRRLLEAEVAEVNRQLARFEQIKKFRVLPGEFTAQGGELSQSLKLKRRVVEERHRPLLETMYGDRPE